jgi:hypothetical protein
MLRTGDKKAAALTLIGDAGKGAIAVLLAAWAAQPFPAGLFQPISVQQVAVRYYSGVLLTRRWGVVLKSVTLPAARRSAGLPEVEITM